MNHSIHSADRATHLKIVVVALVAGISVAAFAITTRSNVDYSQTATHVIKTGKPIVITNSATSMVRYGAQLRVGMLWPPPGGHLLLGPLPGVGRRLADFLAG